MVGSTSIYHATIEVVWRLHQLLKFLICAWCLARSMKLCYQSNYRWVLALAKFVKWALRHNVESRVWAVVSESLRLLPIWPRFGFLTSRRMWTEFVGSLLYSERFFPGFSGFALSPKTKIWCNLLWFSLICSLLNDWSHCAWLNPLRLK